MAVKNVNTYGGFQETTDGLKKEKYVPRTRTERGVATLAPEIPRGNYTTNVTNAPTAESVFEKAAPVGQGDHHLSPIDLKDDQGNVTPVLLPVLQRQELRDARDKEIARDEARFAVTSELPTIGADVEAGVESNIDVARQYLERSAEIAGVQHVASDEARKKADDQAMKVLDEDMVSKFTAGASIINDSLDREGSAMTDLLLDGTLTEAWGVASDQQADAIGPAAFITLAEVANTIKKHGYSDQVTSDPSYKQLEEDISEESSISRLFGSSPKESQMEITSKRGKATHEERKAESLANLREGLAAGPGAGLQSQGVLRGFLNQVDTSMRAKLGGTDVKAGLVTDTGLNLGHKAAIALVTQWVKSGWLTFGKDGKGQIQPLLTESGYNDLKGSDFYTAVFDPVQRQEGKDAQGISGNINLSSFVAPNNNLTVSQLSNTYNRKGSINVKSNLLSATAISQLNLVQLTPEVVTYMILKNGIDRINKELNPEPSSQDVDALFEGTNDIPDATDPISQGVFVRENLEDAKRFGELDEATWKKYFEAQRERLIKNGKSPEVAEKGAIKFANEAINNRVNQINKHINKHLPAMQENPMFSTMNRSPSTGRFFVTGAEVNHQAHSGTLRPGTGWKNLRPVTGVTPEKISGVAAKAKGIFSADGRSGQRAGEHIIAKLHELDKNGELEILDTLLVIGATLARDENALNEKGEGYKRWSYDEYVRYGEKNLKLAGDRGRLLDALAGKQPPAGDPKYNFYHQATDHGKGEWHYPLTVYESARKLSEANGETVYLGHQWETDSTQSNAFIMSIVMGDTQIAGLLGKFLNYADYEKGDLRIVAAETLTDPADNSISDVEKTFYKDAPLQAAMETFFRSINHLENFPKYYGRGIVVAGLYGKTALKMFTEAAKFLSSHNTIDQAKKKLLEEYYLPKFNGDNARANEQLNEDIAELFNTSMKRHMESLAGFQTLMKAIADLQVAAGDITEIKSLVPNENLMLALDETIPEYDQDDMLNYVERAVDQPPQQVTETISNDGEDIEIGKVTRQRSLAAKGGKETYGARYRAALSPTLIQSGDALGIIVATLMANSERGEREVPKNIRTIHDALITGAGSTSLSLIAYNDVFPYILEKQSENLAKNMFESAIEHIENAYVDAKEGNKRVIIGDSGPYKGVMGFFDRQWGKLKGDALPQESFDMLTERERKIYLAKQGFYTEANLARMDEKSKQDYAKSQRKARKVVEWAISKGWKPPIEAYKADREHLAVDADTYLEMVRVITEFNGLNPTGAGQDTLLFTQQRKLQKLGADQHSATYNTHKMNELYGSTERDDYGNVLTESGDRAKMSDMLAKNKGRIKNMPLV